ncbi:MAG: hypothetical protein IPN36_07145 [Bacteroidetes bacterium]|nr:hypothetical protein [Bacteroidota bacterium]
MKAIINGAAEWQIENKGAQLVINGEIQQFDLNHVQSGSYHLILNGVSYEMEVLESDTANKEFLIKVNGKKLQLISEQNTMNC